MVNRRCVVKGCDSPGTAVKRRQLNISLHEIPANLERRQQWIKIIQDSVGFRDRIHFISDHASVCSLHFTSDCYLEGTARLSKTAFPTIFSLQENRSDSRLESSPEPVSDSCTRLLKQFGFDEDDFSINENQIKLASVETDTMLPPKPARMELSDDSTSHKSASPDRLSCSSSSSSSSHLSTSSNSSSSSSESSSSKSSSSRSSSSKSSSPPQSSSSQSPPSKEHVLSKKKRLPPVKKPTAKPVTIDMFKEKQRIINRLRVKISRMQKKIEKLQHELEEERLTQPPFSKDFLEAILRVQDCEKEGVVMATFIMDQIRNFQSRNKRWSDHTLGCCRQLRTKNPGMYEDIRRMGILNLPSRQTVMIKVPKSQLVEKEVVTKPASPAPDDTENTPQTNGEAKEHLETTVAGQVDEIQENQAPVET